MSNIERHVMSDISRMLTDAAREYQEARNDKVASGQVLGTARQRLETVLADYYEAITGEPLLAAGKGSVCKA